MLLTHARTMLAAAVILAAATVSPAAAAPAHPSPTILSPTEQRSYSGSFAGPVVVDLSGAGATSPDQQFHVSYQDLDSGVSHDLGTLTGSAARNEVPIPALGEGRYRVVVDPSWLPDAHTAAAAFQVHPAGSIRVSGDSHQEFGRGKVDLALVLSGVRAGLPVNWDVTTTSGCGGAGQPHCDGASGTVTASGASTQTVPLHDLDSLPGGREYEITVWTSSPHYFWDQVRFHVWPAPRVADLQVTPSTFYPLVRDGFRDRATVRFRTATAAHLQVRVSKGTRTLAWRSWSDLPAGHDLTWRWDGTDRRGRKVDPGRYRVQVTAIDRFGNKHNAVRRVEVATKTVTKRALIERRGTRTTSRARADGCYIDGYSGELTLDCWGGRYARAVYVYRVPRTAFGFRRQIYGEVNCCDDGRITRVGQRTGPRTYRTTITVTDWRSYTVEWADLRYKYTVRR